jgi:hypothetical protein
MRLAIIAKGTAAHQAGTAKAIKAGMAAHGDVAEIFTSDMEFMSRTDFDAVCVWGWRRGKAFRDLGFDVLVMERAYLGDRFAWISLGWNGLNGRAEWPDNASPLRWEQHFADLLQPWRAPAGKARFALLLGQVPSDSACRGVHLETWLNGTAQRLRSMGRQVLFRPHPKAAYVRVPGVTVMAGRTLAEDLAEAEFAVTFNSNSGVEAVLAGVPTITHDPGSMAWAVSSHSVEERLVMPDRLGWAHRMAWRQWLPAEIAAGLAWPHVKGALRVAA